jgi:hypothetical protein
MPVGAASRRYHPAKALSRVAAFCRKREVHEKFTSHSRNVGLCNAVSPYIQDVQ